MDFLNHWRCAVPWLALTFLLVTVYACKHDDPLAEPNEGVLSMQMTEDVLAIMEYEVVTAGYLAPANPSKEDAIDEAERILGIPQYEGRRVVQALHKNGTVAMDIEITDLEGIPDYPSPRLGGPMLPATYQPKYIKLRNGQYQYFNEAGEEIAAHQQPQSDEAFYQSIAEGLGDKVLLSEQGIELFLEVLEEAGFTVQVHAQDAKLYELTHTFDDGHYTKLYLDKELQEVVAKERYDLDGELSMVSHFAYQAQGQGEQAEPLGHRLTVFYESPFSGVKMGINRVSRIKDFEIRKNN